MYNKRNYTFILAIRLVNQYFTSGKSFTSLFAVVDRCIDGILKLQLIRGIDRDDERLIMSITYPTTYDDKKKIMSKFDSILDGRENDIISDSPMEWISVKRLSSNDTDSLFNDIYFLRLEVDKRYVWWAKENKWFIPKDKKTIRWDGAAVLLSRNHKYLFYKSDYRNKKTT